MAEKEGFEPSVLSRVHVLSRDARSATLTLLHNIFDGGGTGIRTLRACALPVFKTGPLAVRTFLHYITHILLKKIPQLIIMVTVKFNW